MEDDDSSADDPPERFDIQIADSQGRLDVNGPLLREVVRRTLDAEGIHSAEISVAVVDDSTIHDLNRRHLAHDYATDVLSFLFDSHPADAGRGANGSRGASSPPSATSSGQQVPRRLAGEIILSAETAVRRAPEFSWGAHDELVLYLVHGLLHLAGYDDRTTSQRTRMRRREQEILALWNLTPHGDAPPTPVAGARRDVQGAAGRASR